MEAHARANKFSQAENNARQRVVQGSESQPAMQTHTSLEDLSIHADIGA